MKTCDYCDRPHNAKGLCLTHYNRMKRNGTLERHRPSQTGESNPNWRGDNAAYMTVHSRLQAQNGSASAHDCVECGLQAQDWAYDYEDPEEKPSKWGIYSTDLDHYRPMCKPCHKTFDFPYRDRNKTGLVSV